MKSFFHTTSLFAFVLILGNINVSAQSSELPPFDAISISGSSRVMLSNDSVHSAYVDPQSESDKVRIEVKNNTLFIEGNGKSQPLVLVSAPVIQKIELTEASTCESKNVIKAGSISIHATEASTTNLILEATAITLNLEEASSITLSGRTEKLILRAEEASVLQAKELRADDIIVHLSEASTATVLPLIKIQGSAEEASTLNITGNPATVEVTADASSGIHGAETPGVLNSESGDTTRVKLGENRVLIYKDKGEEKKKKTENDDDLVRWAGIDFGITGFLNPSGDLSAGTGYELLDLDLSRSFTMGLNVIEKDLNIIGPYVKLVTGLGVEFNNYRFEKNAVLTPNSNPLKGYNDSLATYEKSKLKQNWITAPLLLQFNTSRNPKKSFHLAAGILVGYNFDTYLKRKFTDINGGHHKIKTHDDFNLNPFKYAPTIRLGYGDFTLFASYSLSPAFKDNRGPELYPFTAGLRVLGF